MPPILMPKMAAMNSRHISRSFSLVMGVSTLATNSRLSATSFSSSFASPASHSAIIMW